SEVIPSQEDINELAHGLELSGLPFFWVVRKKYGSVQLPDGFEERLKGRGVVWTSWVPQLRILSHESIGCFLTHCGWGSIIEATRFEYVVVMFPYVSLNARVFAEKKVGIEIPRNKQNGSFTKESVAKLLSLVMFDEEGLVYREKTKEMSFVFGDDILHNLYVEKFVEHLLKHTSVPT
ncbi:UDPGT domain-containing protein, partial [Cephalotus follicularis]